MSLRDAASVAGVGWDTVKRIFQNDMAKEAARINLKEVELLAIDELYLGRLHKFITIVIDWQSGRVLYVAKGRGEDALRPFFRRLALPMPGSRPWPRISVLPMLRPSSNTFPDPCWCPIVSISSSS